MSDLTPARATVTNDYPCCECCLTDPLHPDRHEVSCPTCNNPAADRLRTELDALAAELAHMREARDNARVEVERLTATVDAVIDVAHLDRQRAWSAETFGPAEVRGHRGVLDHIRKELVEIEADPGDVTEWADLIILAFDGAWRSGNAPADTIAAIKAKQERNEARTWPDWRTADPNKAIEHVRALDATRTTPSPLRDAQNRP